MGRVLVQIHADKTGFDTTMKGIKGGLSDLKGMVAGYFTVSAVKSITESTFAFADSLVNASLRLGILPEQLQVLQEAAKENGVEFGKLESQIEKITLAKAKAMKGDMGAAAALKALGVNKEDYSKNSAELLMHNIGGTVKSNTNIESISPALKEVLGKGFGDTIPVLKSDMEGLGDKMRAMGTIMDTGTAVQLKVLGDEFKLLGTTLLTKLAPAILSVSEAIFKAATWILGKIGKGAGFFGAQTADKGVLGTVGLLAKDAGIGLVAGVTLGKVDLESKEQKEKNKVAMGIADTFDLKINWKDFEDQVTRLTKTLNSPASAFEGEPEKVKAKKNAAKSASVYSDSLTATGNMLGASFSRVNQVTALDVAKQHKAVADNQLAESKIQSDFLKTIAAGTDNVANAPWD